MTDRTTTLAQMLYPTQCDVSKTLLLQNASITNSRFRTNLKKNNTSLAYLHNTDMTVKWTFFLETNQRWVELSLESAFVMHHQQPIQSTRFEHYARLEQSKFVF